MVPIRQPMKISTLLLISLLLTFTSCKDGSGSHSGDSSAKRSFVTIGTAPTGGAFAPVGNAIANAVQAGADGNSNLNWKVSTEGTKGTQQNIRALDAGELQFGMANSAITYFAIRGEGAWDKKYGVRHVATLAPNVSQFIALEKSEIKSFADFKGKRVAVGPAGAGFGYFIDPILKAHNIGPDDYKAVNANYSQSVDMLKNGDVDVAFLGGAVPIQAVVQAASTHKVAFVPFDPAAIKSLAEAYPFYRPIKVAKDKYGFLEADFNALSCGEMQLITAASLDDETVYQFTKFLWEQRAEVVKGHPAGKAINEKNVARDVGTEFHPGSAKFYREIGVLK